MWRGLGSSLLLHAFILALLFGFWQVPQPIEIALPPITIKLEGHGASGSPGGSGGNALKPGEAHSAATTLESNQAQTPQQSTAADTAPSQPTTQTTPPLPQPTLSQAVVPLKPPPKTQPKHARHPVSKPVTKPTPAPQPQPAETALAGNPAAKGTGMEGVGGSGNGNVGRSEGEGGFSLFRGSGDDYLEAVRRHLSRYKKYPPDALAKKQEGTVVVTFTLAHDGTVTSAEIERSSGNPLLDEAALAMIRSGSPVPPVPKRYWDKSGPITMPVDFSIGFFEKILR